MRAAATGGLMIRLMTLALLALTSAAPAQDAAETRGHLFAQVHCARCHSIERFGASPNAEAPPFRDLHRRYPIDDLAEALAEGIVTSHPQMPEFVLAPGEIDDLLTYIKAL
jgi:mono/diheme cytochrome c family protein